MCERTPRLLSTVFVLIDVAQQCMFVHEARLLGSAELRYLSFVAMMN